MCLALSAGCSLLRPEPPEPIPCPVCETTICPEPQVIEKVVTRTVPAQCPPPAVEELPQATTAGELQLPIIGAVEWAAVEPPGLVMEARIDTGAETTSIHAEDILLLEKDGKRFVRFAVLDVATGDKVELELPLRRRVLIKRHEGPSERRSVVRMWISVGDTRSRIDVTLSDREVFEFPLLVGRNFLTDSVIVDVSRRYALGAAPPVVGE